MLFFVSVGMLFDPSILVTDPLPVLATLFIIVIGKSHVCVFIVLLFRRRGMRIADHFGQSGADR